MSKETGKEEGQVFKTFDEYLKCFFPEEYEERNKPKDPYEAAAAVVKASAERHMKILTAK